MSDRQAGQRWPWHDCPPCPKGCGAIGCLHPYNPSGWYGPQDATVFCPACGTGWYGTDAEIEQAMAAEAWWEAFEDSGLTEPQFYAAHVAEPIACGKRCFERGCQRPDRHFGKNAKLCPRRECFGGIPCGRCAFLMRRFEESEARAASAPETKPRRDRSA